MTGSRKPLAVYRLLPSGGATRGLLLDMGPNIKLARWLRSGSPSDRPASLSAHWTGDPRWRPSEFPCGLLSAPVLSRRVAEALEEDLASGGSLVPVVVEGADAGKYVLYLVERVVDCVDPKRSSQPKKSRDPLKKTVFLPDALPVDAAAFRVPQTPGAVYWNGWAVDRLTELVGSDLETRLVWSEDPTLTPHPDPMGV